VLDAAACRPSRRGSLAPLAEGRRPRARLAGEAETRARRSCCGTCPGCASSAPTSFQDRASARAGGLDAGLATALAWYRDVLETALAGDAAALRNPAAADAVRLAARRLSPPALLRQLEAVYDTIMPSRRTPTACSPLRPCSSRCARSSAAPAPAGRVPMEEQPVEPGALAVGVRFRPSGRIYDFDPGPPPPRAQRSRAGRDRARPALGTVVVRPACGRHPRPPARHQEGRSRDLARETRTSSASGSTTGRRSSWCAAGTSRSS